MRGGEGGGGKKDNAEKQGTGSDQEITENSSFHGDLQLPYGTGLKKDSDIVSILSAKFSIDLMTSP